MLKELGAYAATILAPPFCAFCRTFLNERVPLCKQCCQAIRAVPSIEIKLASSTSIKIYAISAYEDPLRALILAKNYGSDLASKQLAALLRERIPWDLIECDMLVPIPLHWTRYAGRGFNQAHVIAQSISKRIQKPVVELLKRTRRTLFQSSLNASDRVGNVAGIFENAYTIKEGKHIVLIDDLMTTGATLQAAGRKIVSCKPASITAVVVCRTL